ncbi:hypothetical protein H2201_000370 [Coniosporium apollinis]|uniref:Uncharacterized protein n=1 Tax=Coniosporium apollinis TaxID=61459 RepID=A0ABQ9P9E7_9PEZI|nr:hypothetical protein H2201_000370 [Coniosporium apollinis]
MALAPLSHCSKRTSAALSDEQEMAFLNSLRKNTMPAAEDLILLREQTTRGSAAPSDEQEMAKPTTVRVLSEYDPDIRPQTGFGFPEKKWLILCVIFV